MDVNAAGNSASQMVAAAAGLPVTKLASACMLAFRSCPSPAACQTYTFSGFLQVLLDHL